MPGNLLLEHFKQDPPSTLYHYTGQSGLLGIIKSRSLWATNIHYLNDGAELVHGINYCKSIISELLNNEGRPWAKELLAKFLTHLGGLNRVSIYVFSFSEEGDLLSQWRAYSKKSGYSIGFVPSNVQDSIKEQQFYLAKCIYEWDEHREFQKLLIEKHLNKYSECMVGNDSNTLREKISLDFRYDFLAKAPLLKHPSFSEEKEWRLISFPKKSNDPQIALREGPVSLIPYFNIKLEEKALNVDGSEVTDIGIDRIYTGPSSNSRLCGDAVSLLVSNENIKWGSIVPSSSPYRNW